MDIDHAVKIVQSLRAKKDNLKEKYQALKEEGEEIAREFNAVFRPKGSWKKTLEEVPKINDLIATIEQNSAGEIEYKILKYSGKPDDLLEKWVKLPAL